MTPLIVAVLATLESSMTIPSSSNFWVEFNSRVPGLETALRNKDVELLTRLVDELESHLSQFDHRLNVTVYGGPPFRVGILAHPGAELIAKAFVETSNVPEYWSVGVGLPDDDPLAAVVVRDDAGALLRIAYDDLVSQVVLKDDGRAIIVLALDAEFDPSGIEKHLYQAAANNVVNTLLGGYPPQLQGSVLVPLSSEPPASRAQMRPVRTLREQWQQVVPQVP